jgi:hypothetical protein
MSFSTTLDFPITLDEEFSSWNINNHFKCIQNAEGKAEALTAPTGFKKRQL